jgi:hypothetical protein
MKPYTWALLQLVITEPNRKSPGLFGLPDVLFKDRLPAVVAWTAPEAVLLAHDAVVPTAARAVVSELLNDQKAFDVVEHRFDEYMSETPAVPAAVNRPAESTVSTGIMLLFP